MRMSSVATITVSSDEAFWQRSQTCRNSALPAMRWSGFPGKRVEPHRAGIMATTLLTSLRQNDIGSCAKIFRHPIWIGVRFFRAVTSLDQDRADTRFAATLNIDRLVPNEK